MKYIQHNLLLYVQPCYYFIYFVSILRSLSDPTSSLNACHSVHWENSNSFNQITEMKTLVGY